jgi:hypothetical protein
MDYIQGPKGYADFLFQINNANIYCQKTGEYFCPQLFYWQNITDGPTDPYYGGFTTVELCLKHLEYVRMIPSNVVRVDFNTRKRI